ncbi:Asp-tRNA(Asn)/Glu-tRNA(Gln) amidotransferase A subunit family amidase [Microbacterium phyllosphaerae]|uniref:Asp-tRNA(Asn)/Glu-tRNA(Gln) amidotransferase A subunit family amidase n=1 Tax=Microbacterium phyllosphaerae TaxID=124798 RepID=A0ABS4WLH0_9MICO|nr:amidase family protein [Microbacterium phyllosphaerae]MBP2377055.1 Asp-tRNA(Asn)/Glu-tRNA(Gln) amidotransferase A subunit family amidase [Microbacterium phyllosphaerae]
MKKTTLRIVAAVSVAGSTIVAAGMASGAATAAPVPASVSLPPYYSELDVTGDEMVTTADLSVAADSLGLTEESPGWSRVSVLDTDADGELTVLDLADLSRRIIYDDGPLELVEASVIDMQAAMNAGVVTSESITQEYLDRIAAYDRTVVPGGSRPLNSIITVNEQALASAAAADEIRASQGMTSMLLGVPIALKDNYDTVDMVTTGGCACWNENQTATDASMVTGLRSDGAVILAKASLDEFAYGFVSEFSSFQDPGATSLVASPYDTTKTAGGSSGGTGAAISANLAAIGFGTDTGGSIRVPSSYNQLVGVRPTVGLASRDGIIPLALSQDTGGPMARSVIDAAVALDAVVGVDDADPVTSRQQGLVPDSYTSFLDPDALQGARIGYVTSMVGSNAGTVRLFSEATAALTAQGATVVTVTPPSGFAAVLNEGSGSTNEFLHDLDEYIATHLGPEVEARTLTDILATNSFVTSRRSIYEARNAVTDATYQAWAGETGSHTVQLAAGKTLVTQMMEDLDLDAIIYPSTNAYGTQGTNMRLSPNTGMPSVTVPMGQTVAGETLPGSGVNLEFLGRDFDEGTLLGLAYAFEQTTDARTSPSLYGPLP